MASTSGAMAVLGLLPSFWGTVLLVHEVKCFGSGLGHRVER